MGNNHYYKAANLQGWDLHSGNTINYAENIGRIIKVPNYKAKPVLCSDSVLHACKRPLDIFIVTKIPFRLFLVEGKPVVEDTEKCGFKELTIVEEIPQEKINDLFGFNYLEACKPVHPFKLEPKKVTNEQVMLLQNWVLIYDSVWDSIGGSVGDSVGASIGDSIWEATWYPVWDSVKASLGDEFWDSIWDSVMSSGWAQVWEAVGTSVRASVWDTIRASVGDSFWAYIGSLFPEIKKWKYTEELNLPGYPFQSVVDLWRQGFVPSFDKRTWRLHAGLKGSVVFEIEHVKLKTLTPSNQLQIIMPKQTSKQS